MEVSGSTSVSMQPAYYSYAATLQPSIETYCGTSSFSYKASGELQTQTFELPEYKMPRNSVTLPEDYACVYSITGPDLEYKNTAEIVIYAHQIQGGKLFVY